MPWTPATVNRRRISPPSATRRHTSLSKKHCTLLIHLKRMVHIIAANRLPAICNFEFPKNGPPYGPFRLASLMSSHIQPATSTTSSGGANPADLPVEQSNEV